MRGPNGLLCQCDLRGVNGFPGRIALRLCGLFRTATRYGVMRPLHSVGPTGWPSVEMGIAGIQEDDSRLVRPLRFRFQYLPAIAESGLLPKDMVR
jgi:hypothetical protein